MEKIIIDGVEYEFIATLHKRKSGHTFVSLHKNGQYYRTYKHIWIWMSHNMRHVPKGYIIHHINKDESDDSIDNLMLVTRGEHNRLHADDINHYMFRPGHNYWTHPKTIEHKQKIKQTHINRANKKREELCNSAIEYMINHINCGVSDVVIASGAKKGAHFKRRFGIDFLSLKQIAEDARTTRN